MLWVSLSIAAAYAVSGEEVKEYLMSVYPAASSVSSDRAVALFDSLDYFYAPSPIRGMRVTPRIDFRGTMPPYLPPGAYYSAEPDSGNYAADAGWVAGASNSRWTKPVRVITEKLSTPHDFFSSGGARIGPAPSWTNAMAIVKYPFYPTGLETSTSARPARIPLSLSQLSVKPMTVGDFVEIENFGGPHWVEECEEAGVPCGLWANAWKGTGTFMRISRNHTLLTSGKATAIAELSSRLVSRQQVDDIARYLRVHGELRKVRRAFPEAREGDMLALVVLGLTGMPCDLGIPEYKDSWQQSSWLRSVRSGQVSPYDFVRGLVDRKYSHLADLGLDWLFGICGLGHLARNAKFAGWDTLIMMLSCFVGVKTVIMDRSSNDNGLFSREIVDYDYPGSWKANSNNADRCLPPVSRQHKLPTSRELYEYWKRTDKFVMLDPYDENRSLPCELGGVHLADHLDERESMSVCRATKLARKSVKNIADRRACFLWCRGAASQIHANITDAARPIIHNHYRHHRMRSIDRLDS